METRDKATQEKPRWTRKAALFVGGLAAAATIGYGLEKDAEMYTPDCTGETTVKVEKGDTYTDFAEDLKPENSGQSTAAIAESIDSDLNQDKESGDLQQGELVKTYEECR